MSLIESVPNVSEGRRPDVVRSMADDVRRVDGVRLLDFSSDAAHNRSVFTMAGDETALRVAVLALVERAVLHIDLRLHRGEHPRIGAVDVVPFVPLTGATMTECVSLARLVGREVAERFGIPVYLYEQAATNPSRRALELIRRGGFERLAWKMATPGWAPDFGPLKPHPSAGAMAVGARMALVAFNVNLATGRIEIARAIAAAIRASGGGLPFVKAIGVTLEARGIVQVSTNLTNYAHTSIRQVFEAISKAAHGAGVSVLETEIIGLVPRAALTPADAEALLVKDFTPDRILENRLAGGSSSG